MSVEELGEIAFENGTLNVMEADFVEDEVVESVVAIAEDEGWAAENGETSLAVVMENEILVAEDEEVE